MQRHRSGWSGTFRKLPLAEGDIVPSFADKINIYFDTPPNPTGSDFAFYTYK